MTHRIADRTRSSSYHLFVRSVAFPLLATSLAAQEVATLTANDGVPGDGFGACVHVTSDFAFVGAPLADYSDAGGVMLDDAGAVYVFSRTGQSWSQVAKLTADIPTQGAQFGESLDFDGQTLLIGAPRQRGIYLDLQGGYPFEGEIGALHTFEFGTNGWSQTETLELFPGSPGLNNARFGLSLGVSGNRIAATYQVVDQFGWATNYVRFYEFTGSNWSFQGPIQLVSNEPLGATLCLEGDRAALGSKNEVFLFDFVGGSFIETDRREIFSPTSPPVGTPIHLALRGAEVFISPESQPSDLVGTVSALDYSAGSPPQVTPLPVAPVPGQSVSGEASITALDNDVWMGQKSFDSPTLTNAGSIAHFRRVNGSWSEVGRLLASDPSGVRFLGHRVHASSEFLIASAPGDSIRQGAALVFAVEEHTAFCFGDGADPAGCNDCPCGNESPVGTLGGCRNSSSRSASLLAHGQASVSNDQLRLELVGAKENSFGLLLSGDLALPQSGPCPIGSGVIGTGAPLGGLRCIGSNLQRHGTRTTDSQGNSINDWGTPFGPVGGLLSQFSAAPGTTRQFQVFYRELPAAGCGTGVNTTNAVSVLVRP